MKRLPRVLPMAMKAKLFWGILFLIEAQAEVLIGFALIPKYYIEIVGPLDILLIMSTIFATSFGAILLGKGVVQLQDYLNAKREIGGANLPEYYKKYFHRTQES